MDLRPLSIVLALAACPAAYAQDRTLWERYTAEFLSSDGRIIDYFQDQTSHSEGQAYGMLLAVRYDDRATFDLIWRWTRSNLQVRPDRLFAWQWGLRPNGDWKAIDLNNATDGDILIASALLAAGRAWKRDEYTTEALQVIRDIRTNLAVMVRNRTFLLPGYYGFRKDNGYVLNPSHMILPAFRQFARVDKKDFWDKVALDARYLLDHAVFSAWQLPADWVTADERGIEPSNSGQRHFGADAVRAILYGTAERTNPFSSAVARMLAFYKKSGYVPAWVDLDEDGVSLKPAPAGYYAILARAARQAGDDGAAAALLRDGRRFLDAEPKAYYSFSLYLLATAPEFAAFE